MLIKKFLKAFYVNAIVEIFCVILKVMRGGEESFVATMFNQ
jgi:hypothetical protein